MIRLFLYIFFASAILWGCSDVFEYSPNQAYDKSSLRDLNARNLEKLFAADSDDSLTIVLAGDSQRFYDEVELFVRKVNSMNAVDFVLIAGDISDFGLLEEFKLIVERLERLDAPYFGVVGNHDLVANGERVFERMFGPLNYSFVYDSVKFILHNTNSREFLAPNVPDLEWLERELAPSEDVVNFVAVSHVPPYHEDFDPDLEYGYTSLLRKTPDLLASLHGHIHRHTDWYPYDDGVRYITTNSFQGREFLVIKIASGALWTEIVKY